MQITIHLNKSLYDSLMEDAKYYSLEKGAIINEIITYYRGKKINPDYTNSNNENFDNKINLNLRKENELFYQDLNGQKTSPYIRALIYEYIKLAKYKREEIIFKNQIEKLVYAKDNKRKICITYNNKKRTISPYALISSKEENKLYLISYCDRRKKIVNFIISKMKNVMVLNESIVEIKKEKLDNLIENFDPFNSSTEIVVRLSYEGKKLLDKVQTNRPKLLKISSNGDYVFKCSNLKAQIYFAQFYENAEIIKPLELREIFQKRIENLYKIYQKKTIISKGL